MASPLESDPLVPSATANTTHTKPQFNCLSLKRKYRTTCVTTKESLVVLLWSAVIHTAGFAPIIYIITAPFFVQYSIVLPLLIYYMIGLLIYPLAGFIGDTLFTRFKLLTTGSLMVFVGVASFAATFFSVFSDQGFYLLFIPLLLIVPGIGLFQANVLQYGTDQLDFASSEVISSFVYWYYWTCYVFFAFGSLLMYMLPWLVEQFEIFWVCVCIVGFIFLIVTAACTIGCCCCNRSLRAHPGRRVNPVKLIWRVMHFARKNKHPLRRSAFTYNEWPSRLDLAKQRYGGPFTTEEVEDVKSFWWILLLIASLVGFQFQDDTTYITAVSLTLSNIATSNEDYSSIWVVASFWTISALVIVVAIPVYQFIIRPCFPARILKMVTKMFLGLLVTVVSLTVTTVYTGLLLFSTSVYENQTMYMCNLSYCDPNTTQTLNSSVCSLLSGQYQQPTQDGNIQHTYFVEFSRSLPDFYLLAIPQALNGLSHMLVFLTALEFILAQAPRTFQGFLIGLWYAMQSVGVGISIIGYNSCAVCYWEYYAAKTVLVLLSLVLFVITAHKYKYRRLNEDADVNIHQQIEQIFEENFYREVEYEEKVWREEQQYAYHIVDDSPSI